MSEKPFVCEEHGVVVFEGTCPDCSTSAMKSAFLAGQEMSSPAPFPFLEQRGSYAASWRCRWLRLTCALGLHIWGMGPFSMGRDKPADLIYAQGEFVPEFCSFGFPWCRARKLTPVDRFPDRGTRFSEWRLKRRRS